MTAHGVAGKAGAMAGRVFRKLRQHPDLLLWGPLMLALGVLVLLPWDGLMWSLRRLHEWRTARRQ